MVPSSPFQLLVLSLVPGSSVRKSGQGVFAAGPAQQAHQAEYHDAEHRRRPEDCGPRDDECAQARMGDQQDDEVRNPGERDLQARRDRWEVQCGEYRGPDIEHGEVVVHTGSDRGGDTDHQSRDDGRDVQSPWRDSITERQPNPGSSQATADEDEEDDEGVMRPVPAGQCDDPGHCSPQQEEYGGSVRGEHHGLEESAAFSPHGRRSG